MRKTEEAPEKEVFLFPVLSHHPSSSGSMLLKLRSTNTMGRSLVPALFLSLSSRSFNLTALKASTRSASLPATLTRCSSLWTLSAN